MNLLSNAHIIEHIFVSLYTILDNLRLAVHLIIYLIIIRGNLMRCIFTLWYPSIEFMTLQTATVDVEDMLLSTLLLKPIKYDIVQKLSIGLFTFDLGPL